MGHHRAAILVAVASVVAATLLGPVPVPATAAAPADTLTAVQVVLDARADAVRRHDRPAFLATVDPEAPPGFAATQARSFDGLASLPLASFTLQARVDDTGDLSRAAAGRYGGAPVFLPETRQRYRFAGYDDRDAVAHQWLTFVQRAGRWYVGGDDDLEALGLDTDRGLWDLGPVRTRTSEHVLVLSRPEQAERAANLADLAEQAVARLGQVWDQPWSGRIPVVLPPSVPELERILQSTVDLDKFVAFAVYGFSEDRDYTATAPRIFIQDDRLARYPPATQVETLVHELVHAAASGLAGPFIPTWIHEGLADWAAAGRPPASRRPPGSDGRLPRAHELTTGSRASIATAYRESATAVALLAGRSGAAAPSSLFRVLGTTKVAPGNTDHQVDVALRQITGLGFEDFERTWAARR
ncbi:MAG: hypothetical protein ACRDZW_09240 [Acidimicrobiales bacterium]